MLCVFCICNIKLFIEIQAENIVSRHRPPATLLFEKHEIIWHFELAISKSWAELKPGSKQDCCLEDRKAAALITQPPRLDLQSILFVSKKES